LSHKEEGDEYVIETKEKRKYGAPSDLHPGGRDGRSFSRELSAYEEIRRRAYEIYLERGEQLGRESDDWLQAERDLEQWMRFRPGQPSSIV
jgi:hypothetical protein